ncbi:cytochrome c biogenesis protein [Candidatus Hydrogenedentota bacterium]
MEMRFQNRFRYCSMLLSGFLCLTLIFASSDALGQSREDHSQREPWEKDTLRLFQTIPMQEGGRVKPLDTFASFKLLKFNGKRKCKDLKGKTLSPSEWLMDCLFYPDLAKTYKTFRIETSDVLVAIELPTEKKRDRYSYNQLLPGRQRLFILADKYSRVPSKERTLLQTHLLNLAYNIMEFEALTDFYHFVDHPHFFENSEAVADIFPDGTKTSLSEVLAKTPELYALFDELKDAAGDNPEHESAARLAALGKLLHGAMSAADSASALAIIPPQDTEEKEWFAPSEIPAMAMDPDSPKTGQVGIFAKIEKLALITNDRGEFKANLESLHEELTSRAEARGEYKGIELEVTFYKAKFFYRALVLFIISFLLTALSWMKPGNRITGRIIPLAVSAGALLMVAGITMRCIIRSRPPVTSTYETILFVTVVAVIVSLFVEYVNRRGIALSMAVVLGMLGLFMANRYEMRAGSDTMPSMVAVLDTNFWLAVHVTTIAMGLSAGFLAAAISHIFIFGKAFGLKSNDDAFYKSLTRIVYGVLCFGLFFSFLGTVLGGIWANESWGRFWGWDPKENGALMICLWQIAILHARLGGYIRDLGIHICSVFGAIIVAFAWFGVNMLGVGLHSYGATAAAYKNLMIFYGVEMVVFVIGLSVVLHGRAQKSAQGAGQE